MTDDQTAMTISRLQARIGGPESRLEKTDKSLAPQSHLSRAGLLKAMAVGTVGIVAGETAGSFSAPAVEAAIANEGPTHFTSSEDNVPAVQADHTSTLGAGIVASATIGVTATTSASAYAGVWRSALLS